MWPRRSGPWISRARFAAPHAAVRGATALLAVAAAGCGGAAEDAAPPSRTPAASIQDAALDIAERRAMPGTIAFVSERDGNREVYLVDPDGTSRRLTSAPSAEYPAAPSPDGRALVVVSVDDQSTLHLEQLWLHTIAPDSAPVAPVRIGPRGSRSRNPSWAADGRWLVFESDMGSFADLYRVERDGRDLRRLTEGEKGNFEPDVAVDCERIVFASSRDDNAEIYVMRANGRRQRRLTAFHRDDWGGRWSPAGGTIAFLSNRSGTDRIYLMAPDGTGQRPLTTVQTPATADRASGARAADTAIAGADSTLGEEGIAWSPEGDRMAYVTRGRTAKARIWVADLARGTRTALTSGASNDEAPAWSPDGRFLVFVSDRDGDAELYLMRADGSGVTRLTKAPGADWLPRWMPAPGQGTRGCAGRAG